MRHLPLLIAVSCLAALSAPAAAPASPEPEPAPVAAAATVEPDGLRAKPLRRRATARAAQSSADPLLEEQWGLGTDAGALDVPGAWTRTVGGDVTVAVLDTGARLDHPELAPNLWRNPGEVPGNGVDDDANGYVDDVHGADVIGNDGDPSDGNGHGTHVAGIIAARGGNSIGISGVAWRARVMVVRVLDDNAGGDTDTVSRGLDYAVSQGARIVNLSLAGPGASAQLQTSVRRARDAGVLVVAAAGNDGNDLSVHPSYPASYPEENVIGVAATRLGGLLSAISSFGTGADVAAPGQEVLSTSHRGGYEWRTGTSMAAPHVAGALVLLAAVRPDLSWRDLRGAVVGTARRGLPVEAGTVDANAAVNSVAPAGSAPVPAPAPATVSTSKRRTAKRAPSICWTSRPKKGRGKRICAKRSTVTCKKVRTKQGRKRVCAPRAAYSCKVKRTGKRRDYVCVKRKAGASARKSRRSSRR